MGIIERLKRSLGLRQERFAEKSKAPVDLPVEQKLANRIVEKPQAPVAPPTPQRPPKPVKYFTLGIDFGTHGTKLAYRASDENYPQTKIITLEGSGQLGRSTNVFPSLIGMNDELLTFGYYPTNCITIENFKMRIGLNETELNSGLDYEDLTILFLSFVMGEASKKIESDNPDYRCSIFLHLGAPFADLQDNSSRRVAYVRILNLVWRIYQSDRCSGRWMSIDNARDLIRNVENNPAPSEANWRWLVPEIQAVATSYTQNSNVPRDTYHIMIDMGGFTTDVSIFNTGIPLQPRVNIFASRVITDAIVLYDNSVNKTDFITDLRRQIIDVIQNATNGNPPMLQPGQFTNFLPKALWRIGGGYFRSDIMDELLHPDRFLSGLQLLNRNPQFYNNEDRLLLCVKGLATLHSNLIAIIQARPLPQFQPPPNDGLPFHLQDHR